MHLLKMDIPIGWSWRLCIELKREEIVTPNQPQPRRKALLHNFKGIKNGICKILVKREIGSTFNSDVPSRAFIAWVKEKLHFMVLMKYPVIVKSHA